MTSKVHVLLLAAGRSSRTGGSHKLLASFDGVRLIRRSTEIALRSKASGVTVVTGYRADAMREALAGLPVAIVHNPHFADGLSTSLRTGFARVPPDADGVLVMLADQPALKATHLDRLIDAFSPEGIGSLVVATEGGDWLNPVVLSQSFARDISEITGDKGAKPLLKKHCSFVRTVEIGTAARADVDTLEAIIAAGGLPEDGRS